MNHWRQLVDKRGGLFPYAIALGTAIGLVLSVLVADAAYRTARPLAQADEPIYQPYLYGRLWADYYHRGVDWSPNAGFGDSVYAIADGTVRGIREDLDDYCEYDPQTCPAPGNYVVIRHHEMHYDRVSGQMAYVYSLYYHLRENSVPVSVNDNVYAGTKIGEVDDTGNSTGNHLHLQIKDDAPLSGCKGPDRGVVLTFFNRLVDDSKGLNRLLDRDF